jgi:hypothetical protein
LPASSSTRRYSGRGKIASSVPFSSSVPSAVAPINAAPSASTVTNMKAIKMTMPDTAPANCRLEAAELGRQLREAPTR